MDAGTEISVQIANGFNRSVSTALSLSDYFSVQAAQSAGATVGIYSSEYEWGATVGSDCSFASAAGLPLWYAHCKSIFNSSDWMRRWQ